MIINLRAIWNSIKDVPLTDTFTESYSLKAASPEFSENSKRYKIL